MTTQLTLGGLLDTLATTEHNATLKISGFGGADTPGLLFRHRPFMDGLAIIPAIGHPGMEKSVAQYADHLREFGLGQTLERIGNRRFVDRHPAGLDTPMWVSTRQDLSFHAVTGVEMIKGFAVLRTTNLAPVQGPSIQRIPDYEVINRMRVANLELHGEDIRLAPAAEQYMIRYIPKDRTTVLQRLTEAREDLASFEASLEEKVDLVTKLERDAVRHDYLLGIRDDLPDS